MRLEDVRAGDFVRVETVPSRWRRRSRDGQLTGTLLHAVVFFKRDFSDWDCLSARKSGSMDFLVLSSAAVDSKGHATFPALCNGELGFVRVQDVHVLKFSKVGGKQRWFESG